MHRDGSMVTPFHFNHVRCGRTRLQLELTGHRHA
jgi:hypothetical protein